MSVATPFKCLRMSRIELGEYDPDFGFDYVTLTSEQLNAWLNVMWNGDNLSCTNSINVNVSGTASGNPFSVNINSNQTTSWYSSIYTQSCDMSVQPSLRQYPANVLFYDPLPAYSPSLQFALATRLGSPVLLYRIYSYYETAVPFGAAKAWLLNWFSAYPYFMTVPTNCTVLGTVIPLILQTTDSYYSVITELSPPTITLNGSNYTYP